MQVEIPELVEIRRDMAAVVDYVQIVVACGGKATVTIKDISRIEGIAESQLRKGGRERYILPRYGQSGYPTGVTRWDAMEYAKWRQIPPAERYEGYLAHLKNEMRRKRGKHTA